MGNTQRNIWMVRPHRTGVHSPLRTEEREDAHQLVLSEPSSGDGNKDLGYGSSDAVYAPGPVPSTGYEDGKE